MATNRLRITLWTSHRQFRSRIRHHRWRQVRTSRRRRSYGR